MKYSDQGLVSIILPTYNRSHLLHYAINSIITQSYKNIELIIVNDNSKDNTSEIISSFNDPRIKYLKNDSNLQLPRTLNRGFSVAKGDYLTWTSDDNLLSPQAIEKMVKTLTISNNDFVYADYFLFSDLDSNGRPLNPEPIKQTSVLQLEKSNHIGACFLYSRRLYEHIGDYDPNLFLVEDYDFFIRASKQFSFVHLPEPLYYFKRDENTLYCSRYCEVKASDVLVRLKNNLISDKEALNIVADLITENPSNLKFYGLNHIYNFAEKKSFRLSQLILKILTYIIKAKLRSPLQEICKQFLNHSIDFSDARDKISFEINQLCEIKYIKPSTKTDTK